MESGVSSNSAPRTNGASEGVGEGENRRTLTAEIDKSSSPVMKGLVSVILGLAALAGLYLTSLHSYLLFHSSVEMFGIIVSCGIFMIAWNSRRFVNNNYLLLIGIAYLFVGFIGLLHVLAYEGMGVFPHYGTNLATQLWIAARYVESFSFLIAPLLLRRKFRPGAALSGYSLLTLLLVGSIFLRIFPVCYVEGTGLTTFKIGSEYIICLILAASIGILVQYRREFDRSVLLLLVASIALSIASELAFTLYLSPFGFANLTGHLLEVVSYYLIYKAIIETGLKNPYNLLFRELKESEEATRISESLYRQLSKNLETIVSEKVAELELAQRLASIGQMVSVVAHEVRNPLQNIHMGVDELKRQTAGGGEKAEVLEEIEYGINLLNEIVEELLEYSRPAVLEATPWPIGEIVKRAINTSNAKFEYLNVHVELEQEDRQISVDAAKMIRVLVNLLTNAAEAVREKGDVWIRSSISENGGINFLRLSITDNGAGIADKDLDRIYEPFFTTKTRGTGLGLSICKKIIDAHGGEMSIRSKINEGTTVEIRLPS